MSKIKRAWVDTDEAIELLGVSRATLYAYVSRGRVRSEAVPGGTRCSRYSRDDLERLVARSRERRNPEKAAEQALHWGCRFSSPKITLIADERIYYRGRDASQLARERRWPRWPRRRGRVPRTAPTCSPRQGCGWRGALRGRKCSSSRRRRRRWLSSAAADPLAFDLRPRAVVQTGSRILWLLARVAAGGKPRGEP